MTRNLKLYGKYISSSWCEAMKHRHDGEFVNKNFTLSKKGKANETKIRELINKGYTSNKILSELKKEGLGYKRQTFLRDYSIITGRIKAPTRSVKEPLKYVKKNSVMSNKYYKDGVSRSGFKYLTLVRCVTYNRNTKQYHVFYQYVGHNNLIKRKELERYVEKLKSDSPNKVIKVTPLTGLRNILAL